MVCMLRNSGHGDNDARGVPLLALLAVERLTLLALALATWISYDTI